MISQPLVSYVLISYNQQKYIREAVESALSQSYDNIEFIISDDASSDDTVDIIKGIISKSNRNIRLNVNINNKGLVGNFNYALSLCSGELIVVAAGDDVSLLDRVERSVEVFSKHHDVSFLSFNDQKIDEQGNNISLLYPMCKRDITINFNDYFLDGVDFLCGASRAFRRALFDKFGYLNEDCPTEDTPYIVRGFCLGRCYIFATPGIRYRWHGSNLSSASSVANMKINEISKQYLCDIKKAISLNLISEECYNTVKSWAEYKQLAKILSRKKNILMKVVFLIPHIISNKVIRKNILLKVMGKR
ncbi:glycosyltransferase [Aeromonas caviae]|uniref:glycosyltransferase n=1 Tax=Aeromonas caviae TaxID=648 RepID=UPI0038D1960D